MPCHYPLQAYYAIKKDSDGCNKQVVKFKKSVWNPLDPFVETFPLPCGQCLGCRIDRSKQWAVRCINELRFHEKSCFITLTYSDKFMPYGHSLNYSHFQLFMKRLRKKVGSDLKFFMCGEYGEKTFRPHYHAIIFGYDFPFTVLQDPCDLKSNVLKDKVPWKKNHNGDILYVSKSLDSLWGLGMCTVGTVTYQSCAYVSRYIMKKITGPDADKNYAWTDPVTGEIIMRVPEFCRMSRNPGIGKKFIDKFSSDVYPHDDVIIDGRKYKVPRYYDVNYEIMNPEGMERVRKKRVENCLLRKDDLTPDRLEVKEEIQRLKCQKLVRILD